MCGIAAIVDLEGRRDVVEDLSHMLVQLENRGDLSAGIVSTLRATSGAAFRVIKGNGLARNVLTHDRLEDIFAPSAVGHTRYATSGSREEKLAQPFIHDEGDPHHSFALSFNGNLTNYGQQAEAMRKRGIQLAHDVDTELLRQMFIEQMQLGLRGDIARTLPAIQREIDGSCNVTVLNGAGDVFAYRDQHGFHPLTYAVVNGFAAIASEDRAIKAVWPHANIRDLSPGEALLIRPGAEERVKTLTIANRARVGKCFFEWVYFADYHSTIDGVPVETARYALGAKLAEHDMDLSSDQIVVGVPASAKRAAKGYADKRGLRTVKGIRKNEDVSYRTFIDGDGDNRRQKAQKKYIIDTERMRGEKLVLLDDSVVRGTTMKALISRIRREAGPKEIHLRLACPPILAPCFYAIDFPKTDELIARRFHHGILEQGVLPPEVLQSLADELDVDSIRYLPVDDVADVLGIPRKDLCMACVDGDYPTPGGQKRYNEIVQLGMHRVAS